ncbi:MAG: MBL fold metallo-hydrolase [Deltaproteobacteria bacterium]|nr:MBL fold metallo-hydrolase [Deltaproteobacteria bacterium]
MTTAQDTLATSQGPVEIVPIHHETLLLRVAGKAIYLDPIKDGTYDALPKATHIFLTDIHSDHLDPSTIERLRTPTTVLIGPQAVADKLQGVTVIRNGESRSLDGFTVDAVPMYNLQRGPAPGELFHDKGRGNGYVFTFGDKRVYVSGDTECTPEMRELKNIDVAFLCMNLPYTMPPAEAAECVKAFRPAVVYPYHFRGSDPNELKNSVGAASEVRVRTWY